MNMLERLKKIVEQIGSSKNTLEYWISQQAKDGNITAIGTAKKEECFRTSPNAEVTVPGYELYRVWEIYQGGKPVKKVRKLAIGGVYEGDTSRYEEDVADANLRLKRDAERLQQSGIEVKVTNVFTGEMFKK